MKTHVIQLNEFDDSISIPDKLGWSKAARILIIWPDAGKIQLSILDLLLILRKADALGSQMAIVSDEPRILEQCKYLGIQVFDSIPEAYKKPWRRSTRIKHRRLDENNLEDRSVFVNKSLTHSQQPQRKFPLPLRWVIFLCAIISLLFLVGFFVPSAEIKVKAIPQNRSIEIPAWASPENSNVSVSGGLPVQIIHVIVEDTLEGTSSGYSRIPGNFAQGELTFRNLTAEIVNIPVGTIVQTQQDQPVRFRTLDSLILPPGIDSAGEVEAVSLIGGVLGNVAANSINSVEGVIGGSVAVNNNEQFGGGTDIKSLSPSSSDLLSAQTSVKEKLSAKALQELIDLYEQENLLAKETFSLDKVLFEEMSPPIGTAGERYLYRLRCDYSIWMISLDDIRQLSLQSLQANLPTTFHIDENSLQTQIITQPILDSNGILQLGIMATAQIDPLLNSEELANTIINLDVPSAISKIEQTGDWLVSTAPTISPSFWKKLPYLSMRIKVALDG